MGEWYAAPHRSAGAGQKDEARRAPVTLAAVRARAPLVVLALAAQAAGATSARANAWPQPAAGVSASGGPELIFTFDDGPSPATTGKILDILAERHIKAVFFLVGI